MSQKPFENVEVMSAPPRDPGSPATKYLEAIQMLFKVFPKSLMISLHSTAIERFNEYGRGLVLMTFESLDALNAIIADSKLIALHPTRYIPLSSVKDGNKYTWTNIVEEYNPENGIAIGISVKTNGEQGIASTINVAIGIDIEMPENNGITLHDDNDAETIALRNSIIKYYQDRMIHLAKTSYENSKQKGILVVIADIKWLSNPPWMDNTRVPIKWYTAVKYQSLFPNTPDDMMQLIQNHDPEKCFLISMVVKKADSKLEVNMTQVEFG